MIKIDVKGFIDDRIWFGWQRVWVLDRGAVSQTRHLGLKMGAWRYSGWWADRLWPCRAQSDWHPDWWYKLMYNIDNGNHPGMF